MNILVTGGNGFIGSHVVNQLEKGGHSVVSYDLVAHPKGGPNQIQADILDIKKIGGALKGVDVVYHLAAFSNVNEAYNDPMNCIRVNSLGTLNVLEAARKNDVGRVVFASTVWVYANSNESNVNEETSFIVGGGKSHIYTSTKLAGEFHCFDYKDLYGQDFTILRYGIPYGPGAREAMLIPLFVKKAINGELLTIHGDGSQYRNFVHVSDLAKGNVLALSEKAKNNIYNLSGKEAITIKKVALTIKSVLGDVRVVYADSREGDYNGKNVSFKKAEEELGWKHNVPFLEGMKKYIEWYKQSKG